MDMFIDKLTMFINENSKIIHIALGLLIFLIFLLFRNKLSKGILNVISKIMFKSNEEKRNSFSGSLLRPLSIFFLVLGIFAAIYINIQSATVLRIFKICIIILICWAVVNYLSSNISSFIKIGDDRDSKSSLTAITFITNILRIVVVIFGIVMIISELGYNINGLITGLGVGGLAISLAAQDALSNLISGFIIIFEKPFVVGDMVITDSIQGTVTEITMRSTTIRTLEDSVVTLPNSTVANSNIVNLSRIEKRLIEFEIGLVYSTPNDLVKKCRYDIEQYLINNENIIDSPVRVNLTKLDDSSINISVYCYSSKSDINEHLAVYNDVNLNIKQIIENNGAEFAFPSNSIYIEKK